MTFEGWGGYLECGGEKIPIKKWDPPAATGSSVPVSNSTVCLMINVGGRLVLFTPRRPYPYQFLISVN